MKLKTFTRAAVAALAIPVATAALAVPASAAPDSSPGGTCTSGLVGTGPEALFSKQGGCASSVAQGGLETGEISRAGYVQQCQVIRAVEGFPFDFGYGAPGEFEVRNIGGCATLLQFFHENFGG